MLMFWMKLFLCLDWELKSLFSSDSNECMFYLTALEPLIGLICGELGVSSFWSKSSKMYMLMMCYFMYVDRSKSVNESVIDDDLMFILSFILYFLGMWM